MVAPDILLPLLDVRVHAVSSRDVIAIACGAAESKQKVIIANHNMHSLYLASTNDVFRRYCASFDYRLIDGFPVLVLASLSARRWLGVTCRVGSLDWIPGAVQTHRFMRIAIVGSTATSNDGAVRAIREFSSLSLVRGWAGIDWSSARASCVATELRAFRPDLVLVGLGMPLQESFLATFVQDLPSAVYAVVGGAIDQLSGKQRAAPRWLGPLGMEWLWRFFAEPRRLAFRYFVEPLLLGRALLRRRDL